MEESQLGIKLTPTLIEIENIIWEHEAHKLGPTNFPIEGFRAVIKIFMSAFVDRMHLLSQKEGIASEDSIAMAVKVGEELRKLLKVYANIDTQEFYK